MIQGVHRPKISDFLSEADEAGEVQNARNVLPKEDLKAWSADSSNTDCFPTFPSPVSREWDLKYEPYHMAFHPTSQTSRKYQDMTSS